MAREPGADVVFLQAREKPRDSSKRMTHEMVNSEARDGRKVGCLLKTAVGSERRQATERQGDLSASDEDIGPRLLGPLRTDIMMPRAPRVP